MKRFGTFINEEGSKLQDEKFDNELIFPQFERKVTQEEKQLRKEKIKQDLRKKWNPADKIFEFTVQPAREPGLDSRHTMKDPILSAQPLREEWGSSGKLRSTEHKAESNDVE